MILAGPPQSAPPPDQSATPATLASRPSLVGAARIDHEGRKVSGLTGLERVTDLVVQVLRGGARGEEGAARRGDTEGSDGGAVHRIELIDERGVSTEGKRGRGEAAQPLRRGSAGESPHRRHVESAPLRALANAQTPGKASNTAVERISRACARMLKVRRPLIAVHCGSVDKKEFSVLRNHVTKREQVREKGILGGRTMQERQ